MDSFSPFGEKDNNCLLASHLEQAYDCICGALTPIQSLNRHKTIMIYNMWPLTQKRS